MEPAAVAALFVPSVPPVPSVPELIEVPEDPMLLPGLVPGLVALDEEPDCPAPDEPIPLCPEPDAPGLFSEAPVELPG